MANRTPERIAAFCVALAETAQVRKACDAIGMSRSAVYHWRNSDPEFAAAWDAAQEIATSVLEDAAHERAVDGVREPLFHHGVNVGEVRKYSDTLAIFLLKARNPAKYREKTDLTLSGHLALTTMSDEQLNAEIAKLVAVRTASEPAGTDDDELA